MNRIVVMSIVLLLNILACGQRFVANKALSLATTEWTTFTKNNFSMALPSVWVEGQAEYLPQLFKALSDRHKDIRFVSWFIMPDSRREPCESDALTFFEPGTGPDHDFLQSFVIFICYFGLRNSDGTPKQAWQAWVQEAKEYYK